MILTLIRRDPAWQVLPYATAGSVLLTLWLGSNGIAAMLGGLAGGLLVALRMYHRVGHFEAALPVDGRELLQARLFSMMLCVWMPICAALLTGEILHKRDAHLTGILMGLGVAESLAVIVLQTRRLPEFRVGQTEAALVFGACLGAFLLEFWKMPERVYWLTTAMTAVAGLLWLGWIWPGEPLSFTCAPLTVAGSPGRKAGSRRRASADVPLALHSAKQWAPLIRALYPWKSVMWLAFTLVFPVMMNNPLFGLFYGNAVFAQAIPGMNWSMTLPLPRRAILAIALCPFFVVLTASFVLRDVPPFRQLNQRILVVQVAERDQMQVPFSYWERASASAPVITSPWGETNRPEVRRVLLARYYNPYSVAQENSKRFRDWQFRRATRQLYGQEVPLSRGGDLLRMQPVVSGPRARLLMFMTVVTVAFMMIILGFLPQWPALRESRPVLFQLVTFSPIAVLVSLISLPQLVLPGLRPNIGIEIWVQSLWRVLPESIAATAGISLLVIAGLAILLDRLFAKLEMNTTYAKAMGTITDNAGSAR